MSIFQSQFWGAAKRSWPGDCFLVIHQPFPSMVSISPPHTAVLPEVPLVSSQTKISGRGEKSSSISARRPIGILCGLGVFCLVGIAFAFWLRAVPAGNPDPRFGFNAFYVLFARHEPAGLAVVAVFSLIAAVGLLRGGDAAGQQCDQNPNRAGLLCVLLATIAFVFAAIGTKIVFHDYALTADEYLADFQANIFLHGKLQAEVPSAWVSVERFLNLPFFVQYFPTNHSWNSVYLPIYAAMRAVFQGVGLQSLLNPFLAALTVLAVYGTVRNIWPESKTNALVAIGLLVSSSQFLVMSMTSYSMPAHLALNAIWLWLYSRPDRGWFYLAPLVGVLAIGLHQPIVHALFALPFLLRLVLQRRWRTVLIFGTVYVAGCALWFAWQARYQVGRSDGIGIGSMFKILNPRMPIIQSMNLLLIIGWASLATPLLAVLGASQFFKVRPIIQDSILSCLLTFGFYFFFYLDQAHGWGYRYFYGVLTCLIVCSVAGFNRLSTLVGQRRAMAFVILGAATSFLVQLPLRCWQVERFIRPYARTASAIHSMRQDIVALDCRDAWYSADLIRNDPFLEKRPMIVSLFGLTPAAIAVLEKGGSARFITRDDLTRLGMFTTQRNEYARDPFQLGRGE
jgi:hypothetical protein